MVLKKEPPKETKASKRNHQYIALTSAPPRAIDATFGVVAICSPDYAASSGFLAALRAYASRHGLQTHLHEASLLPKRSIPLAYSKLPALVQAHAQSTATWLWWVDCDTAILDERRPLSDVLAAALTAAAESGDTANGVASDDGGRRWRPAIAAGTRAAATPELLIAYEPWGVDSRIEEPEEPSPKRSIHELLRKRRGAVAAAQARLGHPINTGSFFLRRGPWAAALLRRWWAACNETIRIGHRRGSHRPAVAVAPLHRPRQEQRRQRAPISAV